MSDFVPDDFLPLKKAVDLTGRRLFGAEWTGRETRQLRTPPPKRTVHRLENAVHHLRSLFGTGKLTAVWQADNGTSGKVNTSVWLSQATLGHPLDGRSLFDYGCLYVGNLREQFRARNEGTGNQRILVPKAELEAALSASSKSQHPTSKRYSPSRLKDWYPRYVEEQEAAGKRPSRDNDLAAARRVLGDGVPRDAVRDARRRFAPEEWKNRGRRKNGNK